MKGSGKLLLTWVVAALLTATVAVVGEQKVHGADAGELILLLIICVIQGIATAITAHFLSSRAPHANWSVAKLGLAWFGAAVVVAGLWLADVNAFLLLVFGGGALLAVLFVVTWTWLSARERGPQQRSVE